MTDPDANTIRGNPCIRAVGRGVAGAVCGFVVGGISGVLIERFLFPQLLTSDNRTRVLLAIGGVAAVIGSALAVLSGRREIGGMTKHIVLGVLIGLGISVVLGVFLIPIFGHLKDHTFYNRWTLVVNPIAALLGGMFGWITGAKKKHASKQPLVDSSSDGSRQND